MNSMALDLTSESFHSPTSSVLHFSSAEVYDFTSEPEQGPTSAIDDDEIIRQAQQNIDNDLVASPSLLSLDDYHDRRITRIPRPEVEGSDLDLVHNNQQPDLDESLGTDGHSEGQTSHQLPVLTVNPSMAASIAETATSNVIVIPAPQLPVVNCGGLQLTPQDIQQIQQQLQQRLLSQPMTAAPPVHVNLPPQQYVILGTVNPNMQPQFTLPPAQPHQSYNVAEVPAGPTPTPILQQINNLIPSNTSGSNMAANECVTVNSITPTSKLTKAPAAVRQPAFVKLHSKPEDTAQLKELQNFAKHFKQRRVELGYTQGDVGSALGQRFPNDFSQTTISRFEASNLSAPNMRKLMPLLQRWLDDQEQRSVKLVSDTFASSSSPDAASDAKRRKKRTTIEDSMKDLLELCFQSNPRPNANDLTRIANEHNIERDVVRVWFCNRRQREKKCATRYPVMRPVVIQNNPVYNTPLQVVTAQLIQPPPSQQNDNLSSTVTNSNPVVVSEDTAQTESDKAAFSAAMMSQQGAKMRGYVKPIVIHNG